MTQKSQVPLTPERVRALLNYDPETGIFTWRVNRSNVKAGAQAGNRNSVIGYVQIGIDGKLRLAHRMAFLHQFGECPAFVDHVNHDRADNRLANLRAATCTANSVNRGIPAANTSGVQGVQFCKSTRRWRAVMSIGNRPKHIGRFDTIKEAAAAYASAMLARHGAFVPHHVAACAD